MTTPLVESLKLSRELELSGLPRHRRHARLEVELIWHDGRLVIREVRLAPRAGQSWGLYDMEHIEVPLEVVHEAHASGEALLAQLPMLLHPGLAASWDGSARVEVAGWQAEPSRCSPFAGVVVLG